ncbi:MAG TPA: ABC transporter substrate-binding protein [Acetobacteraceae bacterium]|nr:ABC transporter substrate-binding protein [Acetobacteraceae bacterium]
MPITRRAALAGAAVLGSAPLLRARAQGAPPAIKLGVLTDLGGTYRDTTGPNSVICTRQAIEEFNPSSHGFAVDLIEADHQNKPDVAASIARQWFDQGVDAVIDVPTSSVALAVAQVAKEKDKIMLNGSATTTDLTDKQCSPNTIVWSFDTYMMAQSNGGATVKAGGKSWFFITADYVFGHILEEQTAAVVKAAGGEVKGALRYPFPDTTDFSSYLQQAQASGAQVLGLANAGGDTVNSVKQAHEFGVNQKMKITPLLIFITDVHALGDLAIGLSATTSFYWDWNDRTRAFAKRVQPKLVNGAYPNMAHASNYSMTLHYLKTVAAMGGAANAKKSGRETVARMKGIPTDDDAFGKGAVRADGRGEFPAYLWRVKKPSKPGGWDLFEHVATTPADQALHPLNPSCKFPVTT